MNVRLLVALVVLCVPAWGKDWSLEDREKGWNSDELVRLYFHNSELQNQWAWAALSHYHFKGDERVLDYGSGDGKVTAVVSRLVPDGSVRGVDLSEKMVRFATKMFPYRNLSFVAVENTDFAGVELPHQFDLVTSFCVFHLTPHPEEVLSNLRGHLVPGRKLVATFPIGGNPAFFQAASEEMAKRGWEFPKPTAGTIGMRDPRTVVKIFEEAGFNLEHFEVVETRNPFSTQAEMVDWFEGTLAANWNIPAEGRRAYFEDVTNRYLELQPADAESDGFVYFSIKRIDLVASSQ